MRIDGAALVLTGRTTTIGCTISSPESVSELTWFKDVNKLQLAPNSSKYGGGSIQTPSLTIRNVNDIDKASYRCEATNIAGTGQSKVVHLDVAGNLTYCYFIHNPSWMIQLFTLGIHLFRSSKLLDKNI